MRGILPGATIEKRMAGLVACGGVSQHADALNEFLGQARAAVYASHQPLPEHTR